MADGHIDHGDSHDQDDDDDDGGHGQDVTIEDDDVVDDFDGDSDGDSDGDDEGNIHQYYLTIATYPSYSTPELLQGNQ